MKKIVNFRFTYPVVLGIVLGILSSKFTFENDFLSLVLVNLITVLLFALFYKSKRQTLVSIFAYLITFAIGFIYYKVLIEHYMSLDVGGELAKISGQVDKVFYNGNKTYATLKNVTIDNGYKLTNTKITAVISNGVVNIGDKCQFYANPIFNFKNLSSVHETAIEGCTYTVYVDFKDIIVTQGKLNLFEKISLKIKDILFTNMDSNSAGIAYGLIVGNTSYISGGTKEVYRLAGIFHIFSVSGLHISFLTHLIYKLTKNIKINVFIKNVLIILIITFYSGICSFSLSSLRAVIMCAFMLICSSFGKKYDIINSIALSFVVILLINPCNLFSIGLQLSYLSVIGIIILNRRVVKIFKFLPTKIAQGLSVSVSVTIFTLPILLKVFGYFSVLSILYNLVITPIIYVLFVMLITFVLIGFIIPKFILFKLCEWIIEFVGLIRYTKPHKFVLRSTLYSYSLLPYYFGNLVFSDLVNIKNKNKTIICSISYALFFCVCLVC